MIKEKERKKKRGSGAKRATETRKGTEKRAERARTGEEKASEIRKRAK